MSDQFKIPGFRDRNATIIQGVPIFDPSKFKVKNNIGQESLGEVYTAEFLESGRHSIQRVVIRKALHTLAHDFNLILLASFLGLRSEISRSEFSRHPCYRSHLDDLQ